MSFQWGLIASFLYVEIGVVVLLLLPFISAQRWNKLFKSSFLRGLSAQVNIYFYVILAFLVLCLIDAIREMRKYDVSHDGKAGKEHQHLEQELRNSMVLFRAQRNFYITGFSLFLVFVIRRLMTLLAAQATLGASSEAALRQAASASKAAEELMNKKDAKSDDDATAKKYEETVAKLKEELAEAKKDRSMAIKDLEAIKTQGEGVSREYDRLLEEHDKLTKKLASLEGGDSSDKKDD